MELLHYGHSHPLVSSNEEMKEANCSRCGELMTSPSYCCVQCGFFLHKKCAKAPFEIQHPFHQNHPLKLISKPPYRGCLCNFCGENCELFVYHCSCLLDFHINCALFSLNIAEKKLGELEHIAINDPLISTEDASNKKLERAKCFGCRESLLGFPYFSLDSGFNLHKKCVELPHEINSPFHIKHPLILQFSSENFSCSICQQEPSFKGVFIYFFSPCKFALLIRCTDLPPQINFTCRRKHLLILQFNSENIPCKICQETPPKNFVYCCSSCKFALHIRCASPPLIIERKIHQHPFTLLWIPVSLNWDICGLQGNYVPYICSTCNLVVHKECISVPPMIKVTRHEHPIFHNYFLPKNEFKNWNCEFCDTEVNAEYGSYYCSDCNFIAHVKCATEEEGWYIEIEAKDKDEKLDDDFINPITCVIEENEGGEMTKIKHFSHAHDLILSDNIMDNDKCCDACMLPISNSFYYGPSQCNFLLHKTCSKLPRRKLDLWSHECQQFFVLVVGYIFKCGFCQFEYSSFSYKSNACEGHYCLPCALGDYRITHEGHKHPLFFGRNFEGRCSGSGNDKPGNVFKCKLCNFNLDDCLKLPLTTRHKCDEHPLALNYHECNDYLDYHYCDVCEEERDPSLWFYGCATCGTSAHRECVIGKYRFIKPGSIYKEEVHPHPLTFVNKPCHYPICRKCCKHCQGLAFECAKSTCDYAVHWECVKPAHLSYRRPVALYKTQTDAKLMIVKSSHLESAGTR